jgi:hypothetical protein
MGPAPLNANANCDDLRALGRALHKLHGQKDVTRSACNRLLVSDRMLHWIVALHRKRMESNQIRHCGLGVA